MGPGQPDSCYEVTAEDLIAIMTYGVEQGVREWLLWGNPSSTDPCAEVDVVMGPVLTEAEVWAEWARVVAAVNAASSLE